MFWLLPDFSAERVKMKEFLQFVVTLTLSSGLHRYQNVLYCRLRGGWRLLVPEHSYLVKMLSPGHIQESLDSSQGRKLGQGVVTLTCSCII